MGDGLVGGGDGRAVAAGEGRENVDGPELISEDLSQGVELCLHGAVGCHSDRPAAAGRDRIDGCVDRCLVAADDGDGGAVGGQGVGGRGPDAAGTAGHDGNLAGQIWVNDGGGALTGIGRSEVFLGHEVTSPASR